MKAWSAQMVRAPKIHSSSRSQGLIVYAAATVADREFFPLWANFVFLSLIVWLPLFFPSHHVVLENPRSVPADGAILPQI